MKEATKKFSLDDIKLVKTEESDEFCYAKIKCLSTMPNSHHNPISREVLMSCGNTVLGKWILCDYKYGDATTHTKEEKIVGIVPNDSEVEYVEEEDGNLSMVVDAIISKIYAKEVWDMFQLYNFRNVSCEFLALEGEELPNGDVPILAFDIKGITILGLKVNGSCPNANMEIYKFSEDEALKYYNETKNKDKEDNMEDIKEMSEQKEDIVMAEPSKTDKELACDKEMEEVKEENPNEESQEEKEDKEEETKEMSDEQQEEEPKEEEKEMACGEKKFSLEQFGEFDETKDEFANKVLKEMSAKEIYDTIMTFSQENVELKKFQKDRLDQDRDLKVDAIMAKVKDDLDTKTFSELRKEGVALSLDELSGFENKVKSFAYDSSKDKKKAEQDDIMKFAGSTTQEDIQAELTADDIFNKYL